MRTGDRLYMAPEGEARWINPENPEAAQGKGGHANGGRKGAPCYGKLAAGQTLTLANLQGVSGVVRHIWSTIDKRTPKMLRGLRLDFYWDGAEQPAVSAPWGDFFGLGLGCLVPFECELFNSPEGRNFNSFVPMPFRSGVKVTITNETDEDQNTFWWQLDCTINDELPAEALYFHAHWRRERETTLRRDYEFLPRVEGRGRYLGVNFGVVANRKLYFDSWWGEGEVKIYLDGDREFPTLCGTGTEDYICTSWGQGKFMNRYQGCPVADHANKRYAFYRYHVPDPIGFRREIRATIQQIGCGGETEAALWLKRDQTVFACGRKQRALDLKPAPEGSFWLFERQDDWSSCAYFYLDRPVNDLPAIAPVADRIAGLAEEPR